MWLTEPFSDLPETCRFQYIHACMYGSKRRKSTAFLMNFRAENLQTQCDEQHTHLPWGMFDPHDGSGLKFSTSLETEYPQQLCKQLAMAFLERLQLQGKAPQPPEQCDDQLQKMGAGTQPRGARAPLLLGEFKFKVEVTSSDVPIPATIGPEVHFPFQGVPVDAKLISYSLLKRGVMAGRDLARSQFLEFSDHPGNFSPGPYKWNTPSTTGWPLQFACNNVHSWPLCSRSSHVQS